MEELRSCCTMGDAAVSTGSSRADSYTSISHLIATYTRDRIWSRPVEHLKQALQGQSMLYLPNYAGALRCIGQALENRNIAVFELIVEADQFVVRCGDTNPPYTSIVTLHYSPQRITILDRDNQARRRQMNSYLRFDSLPEILRAAGNYVDSQGGQIRMMTNCSLSEGGVEVQYQTRAGIKSETLSTSVIHDIAVHMFKRRNRISNPIDLLTRRN